MATGQEEHRFDISAISLSDQCEVTTSTDHDFSTYDYVRLMNLNGWILHPMPVEPLNGKRFRIIVTDTDKFKIQDPITHDYIDTTDYTAYVSGGNVYLIEKTFIYEA